MTAPPLPSLTSMQAPTPASPGGRRRSGMDGGYDANGMLRMPGQPNQPSQQQQPAPNYQTSRPPAPSQGSYQPRQTFAQMQAQGVARPAPPPPPAPTQQVGNQLQSSVAQALQQPSRYDLPQVQQVRDALTGQLQQQFGAQQKMLDEEMARRGIGASSIASGYQGDLAGQQANALAGMNASLIQDAAGNFANDRAGALSAGQNYLGSQQQYGLGLGNLGIGQQEANTGAQSVANQFSLGQGQLGLGYGQLGVQQQLGLGNLGIAQQQANTQQAGTLGNLALGQGQLGLSTQLGLGGLSLQQAQQALNEKVQTGQLSLAQANQALAEKQNEQQYGLAQQQFGLQSQLGLGNLNLQQQQLAQQGSQFQQQFGLSQQLGLGNLSISQAQQALQDKVQSGQLSIAQANQALAQLQNSQQFGLQQGQLTGSYTDANGNPVQTLGAQQLSQQGSQFQDQLAQALKLGTMSDTTANRGIDAQAALAKNDLMLRVAQLLASMGGTSGGSGGNTGYGGGSGQVGGTTGGQGGGTVGPPDNAPPVSGSGGALKDRLSQLLGMAA